MEDELTTTRSSIDIPFSEGPVNLSWPAIMKTVQEDPKEFFAEGGWDFLGGSGDAVSDLKREGGLQLTVCLRMTPRLNPRKNQRSRRRAMSSTTNLRKAVTTRMVRSSSVFVHVSSNIFTQPLRNPRATREARTIPRVKTGTRSSERPSGMTESSRKRTGMIRVRMSARDERRMESGKLRELYVGSDVMHVYCLCNQCGTPDV